MVRLQQAKRSFITRNINLTLATKIEERVPKQGDLFLARVDRVRQHTRIENPHGRRVHLYPGDEIIIATGRRYATDQFYAEVPGACGPCHLVAAGGLAADVISKSAKVKAATEITLLGALVNKHEQTLNLSQFISLPILTLPKSLIPTLVVVGSDMNSGKTTTVSACINGLSQQGCQVVGAKLTGTGAGPDYWRMLDAGASEVIDFVDAGHCSTVGLDTTELTGILRRIKQFATQKNADFLIVELADGILQPETRSLLEYSDFINEFSGALVASDSAVAAVMSAETLVSQGIPVYGISGLLTQSLLACEEVAIATGLPVLTPDDLAAENTMEYLKAAILRDQRSVAVSFS